MEMKRFIRELRKYAIPVTVGVLGAGALTSCSEVPDPTTPEPQREYPYYDSLEELNNAGLEFYLPFGTVPKNQDGQRILNINLIWGDQAYDIDLPIDDEGKPAWDGSGVLANGLEWVLNFGGEFNFQPNGVADTAARRLSLIYLLMLMSEQSQDLAAFCGAEIDDYSSMLATLNDISSGKAKLVFDEPENKSRCSEDAWVAAMLAFADRYRGFGEYGTLPGLVSGDILEISNFPTAP